MIKELSLDCGCARSDHSNILPRHLSSRNIGRRQILGFGRNLALLEGKCRQHLHTSQTEAVTPALEGEEIKILSWGLAAILFLTSEVVRKGRFPTLREVIRSTSEGGLRNILNPGWFLSEKCIEMFVKLGRSFNLSYLTNRFCLMNLAGSKLSSNNTRSLFPTEWEIFRFVIRHHQAWCNTINNINIRVTRCQARFCCNKIPQFQRDKHFQQQHAHVFPGRPFLLAGWLWLPEKC